MDNFETAVRRARKHKGYIIAFSFGKGAFEEAARVRAEGLEIALVEVQTLLGGPDLAPPPATDQMTADLMEGIRAATFEPHGTRPDRSIEELIESDTGVAEAQN
ncbi:MAG: hypothetical protein M3R39_06765 [Actinomycetota bacterium]|nr:hypothetical protein [Actinomycetota bacterium]